MLRMIYMAALAAVFVFCFNLFPLGMGMEIYGIFVYIGIMLGMYLSNSMVFDVRRYTIKNYILVKIIDLVFFGTWFLITWELWLIPFFMIFFGAQILLRAFISALVYREEYVTVFGDGELRENIVNSFSKVEGYGYIEFKGERVEELKSFIASNRITLVVLAKLKLTPEEIQEILKLKLAGTEVKGYLDYMLEYEQKVDVSYIDEEWLLNAYGFEILRSHFQNRMKRIFDLGMAFAIGILTAPIMLIAAIIVKLESPGGVIYSQARVGENGREFMVHKFRSMRADAEKHGAQWAQVNDPRVTKFGNFMRKTRIDELPQLLNVIKGEMSFIGPRPERLVFIKELEKQIPYYGLRHMVKPGLTGWAQVMYPYGATVEDARHKLEYDLYYIKAYSLYLDIIIMFKTLKTVVFGRGR